MVHHSVGDGSHCCQNGDVDNHYYHDGDDDGGDDRYCHDGDGVDDYQFGYHCCPVD